MARVPQTELNLRFGEEKFCACKGIRTCLLCEPTKTSVRVAKIPTTQFYQCHNCGKIVDEANVRVDPLTSPLFTCSGQHCGPIVATLRGHCTLVGESFEGVTVVKEFVSREEEEKIVEIIDRSVWAESQSGRRKQDYGPKVNFKRQKVKLGHFNGLPAFSKALVECMNSSVPELQDFVPVELCALEYCPERGSAIDPHLDDEWLWGERLVTLNLLSPTLLTFSLPSCATEILIPLPQRSLVVVGGPARHSWLHSIKRQHIVSRRVGVTLRELSSEFLVEGREEEVGRTILEIAGSFQGQPTNCRPVILQ